MELCCLGADLGEFLIKRARSSAKNALEYEDEIRNAARKEGIEAKQVDELVEELYKFFDIIGASKTTYKEVKTLENIYIKGSKAEFEKGVKYLNEVERKEFEVFVQHDRIIDKNGKLFDTNGSIWKDRLGEAINSNKSIFVMSEKGEIFISKQNEYGKFHHSSFLAGQKVAAAGDIVIENGIIKQISNGHL